MSQLTAEQQQALHLDRNISVTAGAGAGKTRLLVERFLKIALEHYRGKAYKVRKILAITFTNKAAGEMRERIASAVAQRLQQTEDRAERNHLLKIRDELNSTAISTIHSFCARILREYPIEAGVAPDFVELDEMQSQMLMGQAIDLVFQKVDREEEAEERKRYLNLFRLIDRGNVRKMLRKALSQPYEMQTIVQRFTAFDEDAFFKFVEGLWLKNVRQLLPDNVLQEIIAQAVNILSLLTPNNDNSKFQEILNALQKLKNLSSVSPFAAEHYQMVFDALRTFTTKSNSPKAFKTINRLGGKKAWNEQAEQAFLSFSQFCAELLQEVALFNPGPAPGDEDRVFFNAFKTFLELYQLATQFYAQLKDEASGVDFEDLMINTLNLLRKNERVRRELAERYEFIMVDEFQDTNALQWEIITLLASKDGKLQSDRLFVVGDPKQSIYGFRNADIRIFKQVKQIIAEVAGAESAEDYRGNVVLKNSFRFLPRLNAFINDLFATVMETQPGNVYEVEFQPLHAMRKDTEVGTMELALLREDQELSEEDYIAATIHRLVKMEKATCQVNEGGKENEREIEFGDIAVLLRSRANLLDIEQALRRWNIPFKTVKGTGYWERQEIYDFYHLLCFLADPASDFYLTAVLRSELFLVPDDLLFLLAQLEGENLWEKLNGISESTDFSTEVKEELIRIRNLLKKWLSLRDFVPLGELLRTVLDDLHYAAQIGAQINGRQLLANIEKFVERVFNFYKNGINGLRELIAQIEVFFEEDMREGEPQINLEDRTAVKLMTIHAAKGLQFPVVFIPYLNTRSTARSNQQTVFLEQEIGLACKLREESGVLNDNFALLNLLKLEKKKRELAEAKRVFYVGVTRASNYLFLSARIKERPEKTSALEWLVNHFEKKDFDLLNPEVHEVQTDQYTLKIVRNFSRDVATTNEVQSFLEGLKALEQEAQKETAVDPSELEAYLPLEPTPGAITFSATRLMTYRSDPQAYYHRYHLGFFESDYQLFAETIYRSDDALVKGKILHRFLEMLTANSPLQDETRIIEKILFEFDVFDPEKQQEIKKEILELKNKIYQAPEGRKILQASNARNEISVTMRLGNDYFTGTIDRLIFNEETGLWEVVDYKTNRVTGEKVAQAGSAYELQMKGYALLLSRLLPRQEVFPVKLYFVHPAVFYEQRFSQDQIRAIEREFLEIIEEIKQKFPVT